DEHQNPSDVHGAPLPLSRPACLIPQAKVDRLVTGAVVATVGGGFLGDRPHAMRPDHPAPKPESRRPRRGPTARALLTAEPAPRLAELIKLIVQVLDDVLHLNR